MIYEDDKKYYQAVPEIKTVHVAHLKRRDRNEVMRVSRETAERYRPYLHIPIEVTVYRDDDTGTPLQINDGHHRVASARVLGIKTLPCTVKAINALGSTLNTLIEAQGRRDFVNQAWVRTVMREGVMPKGVLTEAAKRPEDLPDDTTVRIEARANMVVVMYQDTITRGPRSRRTSRRGTVGIVSMKHGDRDKIYGACRGAFMVGGSHAESGWGPMLYDLAMECATIMGGGLTSDRLSVSDDAYRVWNHYFKSRSDVKAIQLDIGVPSRDASTYGKRKDYDLGADGKLTPNDPSDDCVQFMSQRHHPGEPWHVSPTSKVYTKKPTMLKKLAKLGKLDVAPFSDKRIKAAAGIRESHEQISGMLLEAAKAPKDLPDGVSIRVETYGAGSLKASYVDSTTHRIHPNIRGRCFARHAGNMDLGDCLDAFIVQGANARPSGYGPLLYDVAMELATILGGGLAADRLLLSDEAYRVWSYYLRSRSDVKRKQLDVDTSYEDDAEGTRADHRDGRYSDPTDMALGFTNADKLTPNDPKDDCVQWTTVQHNGMDKWAASPLAKVYQKKPTTLRELQALGRLVIIKGTDSRIRAAAGGR